ncbi:MCE family protein [Actinopolymorpha alba]|uniref:MCE family protein n=1 Tax=Actinopolymorpha alba TaxID=533267 RepID=UPI000377D7DE|nr:MlaD family protein [Actinopolymorpha alba]
MSPRSLDRPTIAAGFKLTVFVAVTTVATTLLALTIANVGLGRTQEYHAIFTDVTGVEKGDDVRIAGVRVGEVRRIRVVEGPGGGSARGEGEGTLLAELTFTVDADQTLARSTHAAIRFRNLVGQRYLALTEAPGAPESLPAGGTIPVTQTQPALDLTVLFNGFKPLFAALSPQDVNKLAYEIIQVLQGEAGTVESLLARTASLTNTLADKDKVIGDLIDNLTTVLTTVAQRDRRLSELVVELQRFISGLSADRKAIGDSLGSIVALNQQTADLLEDGRGDLKTDIAELGKVAGTLDDNASIVERTLRTMPPKLTTLTRTASYGSWFNFYLCDFDGRIVLPTGQELPRAALHVTDARCQR